MKLTKQTLIKIIKEELEAEKAESINPVELEKQLEPMVAAYLGGANNDASYQVIENFITALMELKSNGGQGLEEATDAPKKFSPEWWAEFEKEFNPKNNQDQEAPEETPSVRDPSQPPAGYVSGIDDDIPPDFKIPRRNMRKYKGR